MSITLSQNGYVRYETPDTNGIARSKTVPNRHAHPESDYNVMMFSGTGCSFGPRSSIWIPDDIMTAGCPNTPLIPDWSTFKILPWASEHTDTGRVICSQSWTDGQPMEAHCRVVCEKLVKRLKDDLGYSFLSACEYEFTLCKVGSEDGEKDIFGNPVITPAFRGVCLKYNIH